MNFISPPVTSFLNPRRIVAALMIINADLVPPRSASAVPGVLAASPIVALPQATAGRAPGVPGTTAVPDVPDDTLGVTTRGGGV